MLQNVLLVIIFVSAPALVLWLCKKLPLLGKIGPILLLYLLGIVIANSGFKAPAMPQIQDLMSSAMVPVAIPLMLFSCTFRKSDTRSQTYALVLGLISVVVSVIVGYLLFGRQLADGEKIGALFTGVYTGGTINLVSLKTMLDVSDETFVILNSYDVVVCFLYLTFLLSFGIKLFRKFLPNETNSLPAVQPMEESQAEKEKFNWKDFSIMMAVTVVIIGVSAGLGLLAGDVFMTVFILVLTTLSIAASFLKFLKCRQLAYEIGMYCIYIFSIVVASMADFSKMDLSGGLHLLGYMCFVIFVSLMLQFLLSKIFKVDADTTVVSSVAYICSPPFVPMITAAMGNKRVLASGLAIGVVGFAVGNYLGFLIYQLLLLL